MNTKHTIFVYGTLRKHERNHRFLDRAECIAKQAWTSGRLFDTGFGYPVMVPEKLGRVYGELYLVNEEQLKAIDHLEGYSPGGSNNFYERREQTIHTDHGMVTAFLYTYNQTHKKIANSFIEHGDWKLAEYLKKNKAIFYFAYGSCMDDKRFETASHYFQKVAGRGILKGYSLRFTRKSIFGGGRADVVEIGGRVEGKVYEVSIECLGYLYTREGVAGGYYRPVVVDISINGVTYPALTFVVVEKQEETAPPLEYLEEIIRGGRGTVSDDYLSELEEYLKNIFNIEIKNL